MDQKSCCKSMKISYNCNMKCFSNITAIIELSESEGVFTTAQAARMDISRDALAHSCRAGRLERICHGAYRMSGTQRRDTDELNAFWKLTNPSLCAWERKRQWDGIAVSGTTAANLQQMGDFYLSPYRMTAPMRINTRNESLSFNMSRTLSRGKIGPGPNDMGSGPLPISTRPRRPRRVLPTLVFAV